MHIEITSFYKEFLKRTLSLNAIMCYGHVIAFFIIHVSMLAMEDYYMFTLFVTSLWR